MGNRGKSIVTEQGNSGTKLMQNTYNVGVLLRIGQMTRISITRALTTARPTSRPIPAPTVVGSPATTILIHINTPIVDFLTTTAVLKPVATLAIFNGLRQILGTMTAHLSRHLLDLVSAVVLSDQ